MDEERRAKSAIEGNECRKEREGAEGGEGTGFETKGRRKNTLALVGRRCSQTHPRRVVLLDGIRVPLITTTLFSPINKRPKQTAVI